MSDQALIKHNMRSNRKPCARCGKGGVNDPNLSLYWAHDPSKPRESDCGSCTSREGRPVNGGFVLIERDGNRHDCQGSGVPEHAPDVAESDAPVPGMLAVGDDKSETLAQLASVLGKLAPTVDMGKITAEVDKIVNGRMSEVIDTINQMTMPTVVHVHRPAGEVKELGGYSHNMLPELILDLQATNPDGTYLSVMMVGPAGTGKSFLAKQAAEALGLQFDELSLGPQTTKSDIIGYKDANGNYHDTAYRRMFEHGGVMHFDEFDAANSAVVTLINAGTSNGHMSFPDGLVKRHPDFRLVCSANTYGNGPDRTYVARQRLDGATKDRFVIEDIHYDLALEDALCRGYGVPESTVASVVRYVRQLRANADRMKLSLIFGTRSTVQTIALLAKGKRWDFAHESRIRCGISDADWSKVSEGVRKPSL